MTEFKYNLFMNIKKPAYQTSTYPEHWQFSRISRRSTIISIMPFSCKNSLRCETFRQFLTNRLFNNTRPRKTNQSIRLSNMNIAFTWPKKPTHHPLLDLLIRRYRATYVSLNVPALHLLLPFSSVK